MRIVVDCRYTRIGRHDGISRYAASLVEELGKLHPVTMLISDHRQLDMLPALPWELVSAPTSVREPLVALTVNKLKPDVVFTPMQTMGSWGRKYKLLLTVHDLIYYRNRTPPRDLAAPIRLLWRLYHLAWWPQRLLLNRADGVVTVSQTTAELIAEHNLTRMPVTVVPNASAMPTNDGALEPRAMPESVRLVYMGSFMPYKNVETLIRATAMIPTAELHIMSRVSDAERSRLSALAPEATIVFHNGASDDEYQHALRSATALVTASLDEGFGIPLVEAMSQGTPIVVSDIAIFREIGGEAALYFEPTSPEQLAVAVGKLAQPGEWERRSATSREQAAIYTWKASAAKLFALIADTARSSDA